MKTDTRSEVLFTEVHVEWSSRHDKHSDWLQTSYCPLKDDSILQFDNKVGV